MADIANTGERILLDKETPQMIARHFFAYKFAKDYCYNKEVLDIGCGEGYGTCYLTEFAKNAVGIDYDKDIINYAKNKYQKDNLVFYVSDAQEQSPIKKKFDVICAFQVLEHIKNVKSFFEYLKNFLNENGIFICSTPNKLDASPHSSTPFNQFHVREYLFLEFKALLEEHFSSTRIFGLKRGKKLNFYRRLKKIGICNFLPPYLNPVEKFYKCINTDNFIIVEKNIETTLDFIAVCKK